MTSHVVQRSILVDTTVGSYANVDRLWKAFSKYSLQRVFAVYLVAAEGFSLMGLGVFFCTILRGF